MRSSHIAVEWEGAQLGVRGWSQSCKRRDNKVSTHTYARAYFQMYINDCVGWNLASSHHMITKEITKCLPMPMTGNMQKTHGARHETIYLCRLCIHTETCQNFMKQGIPHLLVSLVILLDVQRSCPNCKCQVPPRRSLGSLWALCGGHNVHKHWMPTVHNITNIGFNNATSSSGKLPIMCSTAGLPFGTTNLQS